MLGPLWGSLLEDFILFMLFLSEQGLVLLFVSFNIFLIGPCGTPFLVIWACPMYCILSYPNEVLFIEVIQILGRYSICSLLP